MPLFDIQSPQSAKFNLGTNLFFLHRGILPPNGGIGAHFHNHCEEMFIILDGEAQFTIDGRTSVLKGPAGAPTRLGHSHAIYNTSDKTVQWMNINIGLTKDFYDAFNLDDPRVGAPVDPFRPSSPCILIGPCSSQSNICMAAKAPFSIAAHSIPASSSPHGRMSIICSFRPALRSVRTPSRI